MLTEKGLTREVNRLYSNLIEVCRRVFDEGHNYPKKACAEWFVKDLHTIISQEEYRNRLKQEEIAHIIEMSKNLIKTSHIERDSKRILREDLHELKSMLDYALGA